MPSFHPQRFAVKFEFSTKKILKHTSILCGLSRTSLNNKVFVLDGRLVGLD